MNSADLERLRDLFMQEAEDGLNELVRALMALEREPESRAPLDDVFRVAHSLKGGAGMVGFPCTGEYAHRLEDVLEKIRAGDTVVTTSVITLLLQAADALGAIVRSEAAGRPTQLRASDVSLLERLGSSAPVSDAPAEESVGGLAMTRGADDAGRAQARSLRIDMTKLDALLDLSGEITVGMGRMREQLAALGDARVEVPAAEELERLLGSLQEQVMQLRLVPLGPTFRQHERTVRDVAADQGKIVRLVLEGEDIELDASIVAQLRDPLTHMVRNAIDHGVEHPAARRDAKKDPCATLTLCARHERGAVTVEISDDGRGLDRQRILLRARERGLVSAEQIPDDAALLAMIMLPGFSTAAAITELSGRGVGLDVVKRNIESMRGTVELVSEEGRGATVRLRLPLTVAIIEGLAVGVGDERFVIPVDAIEECLTVPDDDEGRAEGILHVRGEPLPYVRLSDRLAVPSATRGRESVVIVRFQDRRAGLVVDRLLGQIQAVLKPLVPPLTGSRGLYGSTVMPDGRIALILDVASLIQPRNIAC